MQNFIKCFYPTKGMEKEAELLTSKGYNISTIEVSVLHSIYASRNNVQKSPSIKDLIQIINENRDELNSSKYIIPYYTMGKVLANPKDSIVDDTGSEFILNILPDSISVKEVLDTYELVPKELRSVVETKKDSL